MKQQLKKLLVPKNKLVVLNFHQVSQHFDPALHHPYIWSDLNFFKAQLDYLKSKHTIVSLEEGVRRIRKRQLSGTCVALTFDDGDKSIENVVVPLLTEKKLPATFFVNSAYPNEKKGYWFNVYHYLKHRHPDKLNERSEAACNIIRNTSNQKEYHDMIRYFNDLDEFIDEKNPFYADPGFWHSLDPELFSVGLHGHHHLRFSMLSKKEKEDCLDRNLEFCRGMKTFKPFVAFPHGQPQDWDLESIHLAGERNLTVFLANGGYNTFADQQVLMRFSVDNVDLKVLMNTLSPFPKVYRRNNHLNLIHEA